MGCGRVGARLAHKLDSIGHSVAIIDKRSEAFDRLSDDFDGQRVSGNGFQRNVLHKAGIAEAYAFIAVSDGDNSNIIAARVAAEVYSVPHVVARIYDAERAEVYEQLGITTIAPVRRTSQAIMRRILPPVANVSWQDPTGSVSLTLLRPHASWIGRPISELQEQTHTRVIFVSGLRGIHTVTDETVIQEHDELYIGVNGDEVDKTRKALCTPRSTDRKTGR